MSLRFQWSYRRLMLAGMAVFAIAAYCNEGYYYPDEHFQILEFANYKMGLTGSGDLAWEFGKQMRPALQPMLAFGVMTVYKALGCQDPFVLAFLLRLGTGLLAVVLFTWLSKKLAGDFIRPASGMVLLGLSLFIWFMPFLSVRFSSENGGAFLLLAGLGLVYPTDPRTRSWRWMAAGLCLGLSFYFRFQMALAIAGLVTWLLANRQFTFRRAILLAAGGGTAAVIGTAADYWFYGTWVFTPWHYFQTDILDSAVSRFDESPFWFYFPDFLLRAVPPVSIALMALLFWGIIRRPRHVMTWIFIPFVAAHMLVSHKEMRFLFPMVFPMLFLVTAGWEAWLEWWKNKRIQRMLLWLLAGINALMLVAVVTQPAQECFLCLRYLYRVSLETPVTVYAEKESPYKIIGLTMHFYDAPHLQVRTVEHFASLADSTLHPGDLLLNRNLTLAPIPGVPAKRVFTHFPDWLLKFDVNGWEERSRVWSVYRVGK